MERSEGTGGDMSYADNTAVSEDRSRHEIERMLMKFGADEFGYYTKAEKAIVAFVYKGLRFEFGVSLPRKDEARFNTTPARRTQRSDDAAYKEWEKEVRRRWRSLCLVIKALLVGVEDGVLKFEEVFLPFLMLDKQGMTVGEIVGPKVAAALLSGKGMPALEWKGEAK
jgi:hypothetical protein